MKKLFFVLISLFLLNSCRGNDDLDTKNLVGNWEWVSSSGGISGQTETPTSTGKTITLNFTEDSKYSFTTNGTITNEGTFSLYKGVSNLTHYEVSFIHFSNLTDLAIQKNQDGELILSDDFYDGYISIYHKK